MRFGNVPALTAPENQRARPALLVDAGPLITLAYANALDLLLRPGWPLRMVDMVLHELTRRDTPTRERIRNFVEGNGIPVMPTQTWQMYQLRVQRAAGSGLPPPRKANLGEMAIQESIMALALQDPPQPAVLLFEDHRIARAGFMLPEGTLRTSTRSFLRMLEQRGFIPSAAEVERCAVEAGRAFSPLEYP